MKWPPLFLSAYILALSCIPCSDTRVCADTSAAIDITAPVHDDHEHDADLCSPFCICICCGMTVVYHTIAAPTPQDPDPSSATRVEYDQYFIPEVYLNIWQPPKIG